MPAKRKKLPKSAYCRPRTKWLKHGKCYCLTRQGGMRSVKKEQCKGVRKRSMKIPYYLKREDRWYKSRKRSK